MNISGTSPNKRFRRVSIIALILCALLLASSVRQGGAGENEENYRKGLENIEAWEVDRAAEIAGDLMERDPANPRHRYLMARVLFYKGEYAAARDVLSASMEQLRVDAHAAFLWEMIGRTVQASRPLTTYREGDLVISLDPAKDSILLPYIRETMSGALEAVERRLGYRPERPLRIEVYPDPESFHLASSLTRRDIEVSGAVGICKFNKIMLISPRALARGYNWLDTLSHEYMHYVIIMMSANRAPVWLHEGMAKYYESVWRSEDGFALDPVPRTLLAGALENDSLITFQEMYPSLVKLETAEEVQLAYAEAVTAVDFITGFAGDAGLGRILRRMAEEPQLDPMQVMESSLGVGGGEFTLLWLKHLRGLKLDPIAGLEVHRHTVKGLLNSSSALDLKEIKSEVSRNHVRLGDMLKQRGRISAAVLEYRRALERSPHSAVVLNRLGNSLARRGAAAEGEEVLRRAERLYPDYGPTYKNLAQIYQTQRKFSLADDYFVKAIRINPFDPSLHAGRLDVLTALGQTEKAGAERAMLEKLFSGSAHKKGAGATDTGDTDE